MKHSGPAPTVSLGPAGEIKRKQQPGLFSETQGGRNKRKGPFPVTSTWVPKAERTGTGSRTAVHGVITALPSKEGSQPWPSFQEQQERHRRSHSLHVTQADKTQGSFSTTGPRPRGPRTHPEPSVFRPPPAPPTGVAGQSQAAGRPGPSGAASKAGERRQPQKGARQNRWAGAEGEARAPAQAARPSAARPAAHLLPELDRHAEGA